MKISEKIIFLRQRENLTREELAKRLGVTEKVLSGWEKGDSVPNIESIVRLSEIFGVSTNILLKDENTLSDEENFKNNLMPKCVSYSDAERFLKAKFKSASLIAIATFLIMAAVGIMLIIMGIPKINENLGAAIGISVLIATVAISVGIYIRAYYMTSEFEYLNNEDFTLEYSCLNMLESMKKAKSQNYAVRSIAATVICIISSIPLIATSIIVGEENPFFIIISLAITLLIAAVGVSMFIVSGVERSAISTLLDNKKARISYSQKLEESVKSAFWTICVAVYLLYSFKSENWSTSWIIFVFAAAISGIISMVFSMIRKASGSEPVDKE